MSFNFATFVVALSRPAPQDVAFDYFTSDETALALVDYVTTKGTGIIRAGQTSTAVRVRVTASLTSLDPKAFKLVISNPRNATLGAVTARECIVSGPPTIAPIPFPGRRVAILGDSTSYMNHHYNPPVPTNSNTPPTMRYGFYATGSTGWFTFCNALMNNALELEPALQPNTNPGVNATAAKNGYNFSIYSSQVAQWNLADFDPLASIDLGSSLAHNIGPYVNAKAHASGFDIAIILGGTNDLSGGLSGSGILTALKTYAYGLAQLGKWVFVFTITPRTADLLQSVNGSGGYSQAQIATIMQTLLDINTGLRTWIATTKPANIFLVDPFSALVGPTASIIPGVPTDPAGMLSPSSGITPGGNVPSTSGNFRSDAPGARMMFDGLHMAKPGAYVMGKALAAAMTAAGVPAAVAGQLGPLTIGSNLIVNSTFAISTAKRVLGAPLKLGRATCLGAPIGWSTPGFPSGYSGNGVDRNANQGQGYTYGAVPDYWFIYRCNNTNDGPTQGGNPSEESYSNFNAYTFSSFTSPIPGQAAGTGVPQAYLADSTWADGALVTSVITDAAGRKGFRLDFTCPVTGNKNEGFVVRYKIAEGQHGPWDNFGYENSATASALPPPYSPGDFIAADAELHYSNLSTNSNFSTARVACQFLTVNPSDYSTSGAVVSGISEVESYFPFNNIANSQEHPDSKVLFRRTPAVQVPTPQTGETLVFLQLDFQFSWDCSAKSARATIDIFAPRIAKITGPAL